jgi:2-keto-4-pentenoate hydratase
VEFLNEKSYWFFESRLAPKDYKIDIKRPLVASEKEGYEIQSEVLAALNWQVGGWKLGGTNEQTREHFNCGGVYFGPLKRENIMRVSGTDTSVFSFPKRLKGEPEIAFLLNKNIVNMEVIEHEIDVLNYVDFFATAFELPAEGQFQQGYTNVGDLLADLCGSGYLIVGSLIEISQLPVFFDSEIKISQDGILIQKGSPNVIIGTPLRALYDFLKLALLLDVELKAGQWIATGGCAPCCNIHPSTNVVVSFDNLETINFTYKLL